MHSLEEKKNIKLIPINPTAYFATPTHSNGPLFLPVIDISGKKYLPVYLKHPTDDNNNQVKFSFFIEEKIIIFV